VVQGSTGNAVLMHVVEIGALNRCGDIARRRPAASRLLKGVGAGKCAGDPMLPARVVESTQVLEYLTGNIGRLT